MEVVLNGVYETSLKTRLWVVHRMERRSDLWVCLDERGYKCHVNSEGRGSDFYLTRRIVTEIDLTREPENGNLRT